MFSPFNFSHCTFIPFHCIEQRFPNGDDAFDAVVGLLGMLEGVLKRRQTGEPQNKAITALEGWILEQVDNLGVSYETACSAIRF
jgi:hypothetical protein